MVNKTTFFSGTDTNTLKEEGADRNHFVSLIVNNKGDYTAAITRRIKSVQNVSEELTYGTFNDEVVKTTEEYTAESSEIEYYMLNITIEGVNNSVLSRLEELKKSKAAKVTKPYTPTTSTFTNTTKYKPTYPKSASESRYHYGNLTQKPAVATKNPVVKQLSFDPYLDDEYTIDYGYIDNVMPTAKDYKNVHFDKYKIKSLVLQLITGSIVMEADVNVDIDKWSRNMVNVFDKRFGRSYAELKDFKAWADSYIDFLCYYTEDPNLDELGLPDDVQAAICAQDLIDELKKLPQNEYIKIYIECLNNCIV